MLNNKKSVFDCENGFLFLEYFVDAAHCFGGVFVGVESGEAEVAFAVLAESYAWGADYVDVVEEVVEEFPRGHAVRAFEPNVWRVVTAGVENAFGFEHVGDEFDVAFVVLDVFVGFGKAFW